MAIHAASSSSPSTAPTPPPKRPPFFVRTLIPSSATPLALTCSLLPPATQLITATTTTLTIFAITPATASLTPLCSHPLATAPRSLAFLPSPTAPILLVLSASSHLSFFRFDPHCLRLVRVGTTALHPTPPHSSHNPHLLALHPTKRLLAHASLSSHLSFYPLLFLAEGVSAGKAIHHRVPGVILAIDFLHDDGNVAAFVALIQGHTVQQIDLFTVTFQPSGALSVTRAPSMQNCAPLPPRPTTNPSKIPSRAVSISRIPHRSYMFAIYHSGHVVVADARSVVDSGLHAAAHSNASSIMTFTKASVPPSPVYLPPTTLPRPTTAVAAAAAAAAAAEHTASAWRYTDGWRPARSGPPATPRPRALAQASHQVTDPVRLAQTYLVAPPHLILDFGLANGAACVCVDAARHFTGIVEGEDGAAVYFATESGALFALRCGEGERVGVPSEVIPDMPPPWPGYDPSRHSYFVEFIGDVGPACALAALDDRLIYVANDAADGSLRRLHVPSVEETGRIFRNQHQALATGESIAVEHRRYGLEVRQEFLNLAPISDFVIVPPVRQRTRRRKKKPRTTDTLTSSTGSRFEEQDRDVDMEYKPTPPRLDLSADPRLAERERALREQAEQTSAYSYTVYGGAHESEMISCSGLGKHGSIRIIRPGAPVTIFASSGSTFPACNDIWPIRFTRDARHDAGLLLTFAESTGLLYSVPMSPSEQMHQPDGLPAVAKLVSGGQATNICSNVRTLAVGALVDGVLAQIHENGIRLMYMKTVDEVPFHMQNAVVNGELIEPICKRTIDWEPPDGGKISVGSIGEGFALVCIVRGGLQTPLLCLLKFDQEEFDNGLSVTATKTLEQELSSILIPEWANRPGSGEFTLVPNLPPVAILGTYAPAVEVLRLSSTLDTVDRRATYPWTLEPFSGDSLNSLRSGFEDLSGPAKPAHDVKRCNNRSANRSPMSALSRSTAVPESFCTLEVDGKRLIFAGLRDGSVMCFSFTPVDSASHMGITLPFAWRIMLDSHRKLGHRPVVVRSFVAALGPVVVGQTERPWVCTSYGSGRLKWIPLAFTESRAVCGYSIVGAERCFAMLGDDDAMHICGFRRRSEVTVRSIHIGVTPRRILALLRPPNSVLVATTRAVVDDTSQQLRTDQSDKGLRMDRDIHCELRIYNTRLRVQTGGLSLLPNEQVHVLFNWQGLIVIGTSFDMRADKSSGAGKVCEGGRLLLCAVNLKGKHVGSSPALCAETSLIVCSEVVLPGAILSGAGHPKARALVISCNDEVIVFGMPRSKNALLEIGRSTLRSLVVSVSICDDMICVVDRHDSVGFFSFESESGKLVRDRCDHRRRIVSDAVMVDRKLAVGADRRGGLFSVGYDDGDGPPDTATDWSTAHKLIDQTFALASLEPTNIEEMKNSGCSQGDSSNLGAGENFGAQTSNAEITGQSMAEQDQVSESSTENESAGIEVGAIVMDGNEGDEAGGETNGAAGGEPGDVGGNAENEGPGAAGAEGMEVEAPNPPGGATGTSNQGADDKIAMQVPRNLMCHHSFNMRSTTLRVRLGSFSRREKRAELEEMSLERDSGNESEQEQFFEEASGAIFCGTLSGAVIAAIPMSRGMYALLGRVEKEMGMVGDIEDFGLGSSFAESRGWDGDVYDEEKKGTIDGDLLDYFGGLPRQEQLAIAERVGCSGERGVLLIEGTIRDLFDRVG